MASESAPNPTPSPDSYLDLSRAARVSPGRPHTATIWRWCRKGCRPPREQSLTQRLREILNTPGPDGVTPLDEAAAELLTIALEDPDPGRRLAALKLIMERVDVKAVQSVDMQVSQHQIKYDKFTDEMRERIYERMGMEVDESYVPPSKRKE